VFGGVQHKSGETFLVHPPYRTVDTSKAFIEAWIKTGTTVISDCWTAYRDLDAQGYTHHTVNHSTGFLYQRTGVHTNTIKYMWRHIKAFLNPYNS